MMRSRAPALGDLEVLVVDCQATGSRPDSGRLLELGWLPMRAAGHNPAAGVDLEVLSSLFRIPRRVVLPPQALKITGIDPENLKQAPSARRVWDSFLRSAREITARSGSELCPTVIHFRRYEEPFLHWIHNKSPGGQPFPLDIVCTHQIVRRLLPGLPRKGLRAVAGYFGYPLPELRRSSFHVQATALIWRHLVELLEGEVGLTGFEDLKDWLALPSASPSPVPGKRVYPMEKRLREGLPDRPGVYRMYRLNGDILYVGKARSLKRRVNAYFQPQGRHAEHILEMLSQAKDLTVTPTGTALEAALLETDEIKRLSPPFNRALQAHSREIWYASTDLLSFRPSCRDLTHPIGPLAARSRVAPLGPLLSLLRQRNPRIGVRMLQEILDIPREYLPDRKVFLSGIRVFQDLYRGQIAAGMGLTSLRALGACLWREKLAEKAAEAKEKRGTGGPAWDREEEGEVPAPEPGIWDEERVVRILGGIIRSGTYQIRRSRWLLRLCESGLSWKDREDPKLRHVVVFEGGRPFFPGPLGAEDEVPVPERWQRSLGDRQEYFDIAAYDRLRVLTTEIRRLCGEGREPELCLFPPRWIDQPRLLKMLSWV